jgi:hypothetical protein
MAVITTKLEGYLIGFVALLLGTGAFGFYFYHKGKSAELAAAAAENARITKAATDRIAALTSTYNLALSASEHQYETSKAAADQQHIADLARLRAATAHQGNPVLRGAAGSGGEPDSAGGTAGAGSVGDLSAAAVVSSDLAAALRADDDLLNLCRADRDALTGK